MKFFVGAVTKQIIERHLIRNLSKVLSPIVVAHFTEEELQFVASEPEEALQMREHLEDRMTMLEEGQLAFRMALGQMR
jgi:hypothetical protein